MAETITIRPGLRFEKLTIALGPTRLIALDCTIAPGEVLTVMGPSGSGKSTLLAAITGTLDPAFTMTGRINNDVITIVRGEENLGCINGHCLVTLCLKRIKDE